MRDSTSRAGDNASGGYGLGVAALVLAAALWSLNGPLIKLLNAGGEGVPAETIACLRSLFGGLVMLPAARRGWVVVAAAPPFWPILSVTMLTALTFTFVKASTMTAAANAIILQYTAPLWVFLLSPWLLGERPRARDGLVLLLTMAGVFVILAGNPPGEMNALLVATSSGVFFALLQIVLRKLRHVPPATIVAMNFLGSGLLLAPLALGAGLPGTLWQWLLLAAMGVIQFSLPYLIFSWALRYVEAHRAALLVLLEAVLNPAWTWLAVGEPVPGPTLMGGPLIVLGVALWMVLCARNTEKAD